MSNAKTGQAILSFLLHSAEMICLLVLKGHRGLNPAAAATADILFCIFLLLWFLLGDVCTTGRCKSSDGDVFYLDYSKFAFWTGIVLW